MPKIPVFIILCLICVFWLPAAALAQEGRPPEPTGVLKVSGLGQPGPLVAETDRYEAARRLAGMEARRLLLEQLQALAAEGSLDRDVDGVSARSRLLAMARVVSERSLGDGRVEMVMGLDLDEAVARGLLVPPQPKPEPEPTPEPTPDSPQPAQPAEVVQ